MTTTPGSTEPSADQRRAAAHIWQMYVALTKEGFSEKQSLAILGQMLAASIAKGDG